MAGKNMLDQEFDEFEVKDDLPVFRDDKSSQKEDKSDDDQVEVSIVDDTPEADRGKWSADEKSTDEGDDEQAAYSKRVKDRIAKETAKVHAERRAKEDRERQLTELAELSKRILAENNALKGLIENGEKVLMTESQGRLAGQINAAKMQLREARDAGDINGEIAAQENLAKLVAEKDRLSTHRPQPLQRMDEREFGRFTQPAPQQQAEPEAAAVEWQGKNKWFGRDEAMTAFALGVHQQLVNREGILPSDGDEYYRRIDGEMHKRFPERFQQTTTPRRTETVVAGAVRSQSKATRKVTLTQSQAHLARRLGLTLEQYAEQLTAESGKKEWTHG